MTSPLSTAFVLKSVEVKNWKTFTEATLNVELSGLTGIVGQNGSGKSSFVDAILWCLFGAQPKGVTKGALRRRKADKKTDETFVKVTFLHAGQTVEVFRRMKGKNDTVTAGTFLDGNEVTVDTGSTVEKWVINRLGMDAQGFRTAIVVPQKELDSLVDALPSVRREHIEKLAGIEDMNLAVKKAREGENDLAKQIKVLPGSIEAVEEAGELMESIVSELSGVDNLYGNASEEVTKLDNAVSAVINKSSDSKEKLKKASEIHKDIVNLEHTVDLTRSQISDVQKQINAIGDEISGVDVSARPALENEYREVNEEYSRVNHELANHTGNLSNAQKTVASLEQSIASKKAKLSVAEGNILSQEAVLAEISPVDALKTKRDSLEAELATSTGRISSLESLVADLGESVRMLDSHDHSEAQCPTCHTHLDNPEKLVDQFKATIDSSKAEILSLKDSVKTLRGSVQDTDSLMNRRERLERDIEAAKGAVTTLQEDISALESELDAAKDSLASFEGFDAADAQAKIAKLDLKKREILSSGEKIAAAERAIAKRESLINQRESLEAKASPLKENLAALESELDSYGDLNHLEMIVSDFDAELEGLRHEQSEAFRKMKDLETRKASLTERVRGAESVLEREEKLAKAKTVALSKLEEMSAVSDLLDEYRKERIARIAPELSSTATDLISKMTNGRFEEVIVYDDFATSVIKDDGEEYSVSELSGGEKSVVALALRISIGSLITGENAGLLWLDEVLPAQDAERRDAILNVLRSLPIQQIVMINHTHEAEDVVDRVVKISYDGTGSTIE